MTHTKIAYFISSHGFGHASRTAAIIEALSKALARDGKMSEFTIYTETPQWFFEDSLTVPFNYHRTTVDVGMIQLTPIVMDIPGTVTKVKSFLDSLPEESDRIAIELKQNGIDLVIADISPLGIVAAEKAGIPSVMFENFTWDWIYETFIPEHPEFGKICNSLRNIFKRATFHGQFAPVCEPNSACDILLPPVSREPRTAPSLIREQIGIRPNEKMALIAMGGVPSKMATEDRIDTAYDNVVFVLSGDYEKIERRNNIIFIPHHSDFYHPDLVNAADFVFGKAGYSTCSEIYNMGKPFAYLLRPDFRESNVLGSALKSISFAFEIDAHDFNKLHLDYWIAQMALCRKSQSLINGADVAAEFLMDALTKEKQHDHLVKAVAV